MPRATATRVGPRPLPLHLATALEGWMSSRAALPLLRSGSIAWRPDLAPRAEALRQRIDGERAEESPVGGVEGAAFDRAVDVEVRRRLAAFHEGVQAYRRHPYRREVEAPRALWREGTTTLLDYGAAVPGAARGRPVLFVPSLINRAYILDLSEKRSLVRGLGARGIRPLLVDWDAPGARERRFTLTDYIAGRLERALSAAAGIAGGPIPVVGYCMGGLLALALAARRPDQVERLALLATPWDFHGDAWARVQARAAAATLVLWSPLLETLGELPVDVVQALFYTIDPFLVLRKFVNFARLDPSSARAAEFVALEDWLNDGVGLAAPVARECLGGWYGENTPARTEWRIAGRAVDPADVVCPSLVVVPRNDRIVPPASAEVLARIPGATTFAPELGHIGMVVGARARETVWRPLAEWLSGG
ncbi:MAG: alpha/beta fold hydrolase [Alphaproteobacteria bacterium]